ncbi:hypothetical protein AVEN_234366-1 [Araneus ventricosus]|uniref:Uncharacterized protein n=1 Tax=Araneus ventricosus TaxID=182803 RepID=A0A4Y2A8H4_ARAVE|nr:hypothetical protein AVEN_234366-1 [Araneus ventricosus]
MAFLSTTCKNSHHYFSLVSTLPIKVNVAPRPSNPRFVTLNCLVPVTYSTLSINACLRTLWSCLVSSQVSSPLRTLWSLCPSTLCYTAPAQGSIVLPQAVDTSRRMLC